MNHLLAIETSYIFKDDVLNAIYERATKKFFPLAENQVVFFDLVKYIKQQLHWKKQCEYTHGLPILKAVCSRISEDFYTGCEYQCSNAKCYRDYYFSIFF